MSDDEMEIDDIDLEDVYEEDHLTPEDVFKMVTLNRTRGIRVKTELRDKDNEAVDLTNIVEELLLYMKDKLSDPASSELASQIMPLMSQAMVSGLGRLIGIRHTGAIITSDILNFSMVQMMCMALLMLKFIQKKELKIFTYEEDISPEEIEDLDRRAEVTKATVVGSLMGLEPREMLRELLKQGKISKEDVTAALGDEIDLDDDDEDQ